MDAQTSIKKYQLPCNIRQEIRSCIAVKVLSSIFKMHKMTTRMMYEKMFSMYHGTTDIYAHIDQLLKASGPYESMFEKRVDTACNSTTTSAVSLVLNKQMFALESSNYIVGKHIIKKTLESTTFKLDSPLISGRTLHAMALKCLRNMKKALAVLQGMPEVTSLTPMGVELKSGLSEDEVKSKLLDLMYTELKGKVDLPDDEDL